MKLICHGRSFIFLEASLPCVIVKLSMNAITFCDRVATGFVQGMTASRNIVKAR
jgi:hypothetical protein